ncbi:hypothetical protein GCM10022384_43140 [Streptomyces marokkonensis]|uniref:Uncharacterized protein n=1 Tax=Streptomyces marokkonensis TaxID=324855 RepID=A0ABP7R005_9ACTN
MDSRTQRTETTRSTTGSTESRQTPSRREDICPSCGHHVPAEIKRHKTLGIYVPEWHPGTCRNPDCPSSESDRHR